MKETPKNFGVEFFGSCFRKKKNWWLFLCRFFKHRLRYSICLVEQLHLSKCCCTGKRSRSNWKGIIHLVRSQNFRKTNISYPLNLLNKWSQTQLCNIVTNFINFIILSTLLKDLRCLEKSSMSNDAAQFTLQPPRFTAWKVSKHCRVLVRIFPHSDWIRRDIWTHFTQWLLTGEEDEV